MAECHEFAIPGQEKPGSIADVKVDSRVNVLYKPGEAGKNLALSVRIMPEGSAPKGGPKAGG